MEGLILLMIYQGVLWLSLYDIHDVEEGDINVSDNIAGSSVVNGVAERYDDAGGSNLGVDASGTASDAITEGFWSMF